MKRDLRIELRRAYEIISVLLFTVAAIFVASIAWGAPVAIGPEAGAAALWLILFFTSTLTFTTSFTREMDRGTIGGLRTLPCPPLSILLGKALYSLVLLMGVVFMILPVSVVLLNLPVAERLGELVLILVLGVAGLSFTGSFISGLVMYSEGKVLLLPFLLFPTVMPLLISSVLATEKILWGLPLIEVWNEIQLLLTFLVAVLLISTLTFGGVMEE